MFHTRCQVIAGGRERKKHSIDFLLLLLLDSSHIPLTEIVGKSKEQIELWWSVSHIQYISGELYQRSVRNGLKFYVRQCVRNENRLYNIYTWSLSSTEIWHILRPTLNGKIWKFTINYVGFEVQFVLRAEFGKGGRRRSFGRFDSLNRINSFLVIIFPSVSFKFKLYVVWVVEIAFGHTDEWFRHRNAEYPKIQGKHTHTHILCSWMVGERHSVRVVVILAHSVFGVPIQYKLSE